MKAKLFALLLSLPAPAFADGGSLFTAAGNWQGEGRIATSVKAPLERGRCRVAVTQDDAGQQADITGKCVVAGGASNVAMRFIQGDGTAVRAGIWSQATDSTLQFAGDQTGDALRLRNTDPLVIDAVAYTARIDVNFDGPDSFTLRQILREGDAEEWRLMVDMAFTRN